MKLFQRSNKGVNQTFVLRNKGYHSRKICSTWIFSLYAHIDLLCSTPANISFKYVKQRRSFWEDKIKFEIYLSTAKGA